MKKLALTNGIFLVIAAVTFAATARQATAAEEPAAKPAVDAKAYQKMVDRAIGFLKTKGQAEDGSYTSFAGPGVTALVTAGVMRNGRSPDDPLVAKSLKYLEGFVQPDGGIYKTGTFYRNYETSVCLLCFVEANKDGRYKKIIAGADRFLKGLQWDEDEEQKPEDLGYGGAGYGRHKRPDLSNTSFLVDALIAAGNGPDDEAVKKALIFINRCQNLETEHNTTKFSTKNPDGGFYYTPAAGGSSQAGETAAGGLRSYASMTYAGLKSMLYAGVKADDPRVKAALAWAEKHYDLSTNPGLGSAGLYYYYHVFAKALDATGKDYIEDADGKKHNWRADLIAKLIEKQQADGSWVNENERWLEGDPNLVTAYALLSLAYCRPALEKK